MTDKKRKF